MLGKVRENQYRGTEKQDIKGRKRFLPPLRRRESECQTTTSPGTEVAGWLFSAMCPSCFFRLPPPIPDLILSDLCCSSFPTVEGYRITTPTVSTLTALRTPTFLHQPTHHAVSIPRKSPPVEVHSRSPPTCCVQPQTRKARQTSGPPPSARPTTTLLCDRSSQTETTTDKYKDKSSPAQPIPPRHCARLPDPAPQHHSRAHQHGAHPLPDANNGPPSPNTIPELVLHSHCHRSGGRVRVARRDLPRSSPPPLGAPRDDCNIASKRRKHRNK